MDTQHIGIIGAGELGAALGHALEKTGLTISYYDKQDDRSTVASIADLLASCGMILVCTPSWTSREVSQELGRHLRADRVPLVISLSKGVERGFVTIDTLLADSLPRDVPYGIIYGPMLANEIAAHQMGSGVLALSDIEYAGVVRDIFARARIYLELTNDLHGTAVSGALKNIYAMAFGMCDGLKLGANARGRLAVVVLREMKRILAAVGAKPETAEGLAGLGDLVATGTADSSFNYRVGRSIAEGIADENIKSEGLVALKELSHLIQLREYPLAHLLDQLIYHYAEPREFQKLLEV